MGVLAQRLRLEPQSTNHPSRALLAHPLSVGSADTFPRKGERTAIKKRPPRLPLAAWSVVAVGGSYSMMLATTPAPTVRPPSRMAKRSFSSIAIGTISVTSMAMLSPGITISVPSGSVTTPVTSVVRK